MPQAQEKRKVQKRFIDEEDVIESRLLSLHWKQTAFHEAEETVEYPAYKTVPIQILSICIMSTVVKIDCEMII
jgi:hypothetical protein